MKKKDRDKKRYRIVVDIDKELYIELQERVGKYRLKSLLFSAMTKLLLKRMDKEGAAKVIAEILNGDITLSVSKKDKV